MMALSTEEQRRLDRIRRVAFIMDAEFRIFGFPIGLDSIIGLIPWLGDAIGAVAATYIVIEAQQLGLPAERLRVMLFNVAIDFLVGGVPVLGDFFDLFFKANLRNLKVIEDYLALRP